MTKAGSAAFNTLLAAFLTTSMILYLAGVGSEGAATVGAGVGATVGGGTGFVGSSGVAATVGVGVGVGVASAAFFFLGVQETANTIIRNIIRILIASNPYTTASTVISVGYLKITRHRRLPVQKPC